MNYNKLLKIARKHKGVEEWDNTHEYRVDGEYHYDWTETKPFYFPAVDDAMNFAAEVGADAVQRVIAERTRRPTFSWRYV